MTGTHLPINQHAVHHIHARIMSNVVIGPGGQATLVAPTQPESSNAIVSSMSVINIASATQQAVFTSPSTATSDISLTSIISSSSATPTTSGLVEVSTTVVVTSEVVETSTTSSSSPTTSNASSDSESATPTTFVDLSTTSLATIPPTTSVDSTTASLASTSTSDASTNLLSTVSSSSSTTASPSSLAAATTSSATNTSATKESTLYIGIVLGTIIVIACFAALIAWWFRLRTHNRRRKKSVAVPWANRPESSLSSFTDSDLLEKGEPPDPHRHTWEPRGDRDAGEPKRTKSYLEDIGSPVKRQSLPILSLPSPPPAIYPFRDHPLPQYPTSCSSLFPSVSLSSVEPLQESVAYPLPSSSGSRFTMNIHPNPSSVHMQFLTDPEFGTPRESKIKPRYLSLNQGLEVPWNTEAPALALATYPLPVPSENVPSSPASLSEKHPQTQEITPFADVPASVSSSQAGTWSSTFKANLVFAFNAVAKAAGGIRSDEEYDKLSPLPSRNASRNCKNIIRRDKSTSAPVPETVWVEYLGGELVGKAPALITSTTSEASQADEGIGTVHVRTSFSRDGLLPFPGTVDSALTTLGPAFGTGMGLESYRGNDNAFSSLPSTQRSMTPSRQISNTSYTSTAALVVKKKSRSTGTTRSSANAHSRISGSQRRPRYAYSGEMTAVSRRGSLASSRAPELPALPSFSHSRSRSMASSLSRISTTRSMKSTRSILTNREERARKALIERQRKGNAMC
ncbi:uncharacterized protein C8R40DRAFT_500940 [Lentinula edodes]|uniref:uncharacterized protein n=1 Tax=Lentinula edodes TaxID=5353 RepID=UPI001E8EEA91|nr:uncharacterized protein C8R40DRAFT_500940 [Lentinula edodes]KAH7872105.1 hypothetical protein C8R40DRAFT_500940 [Lentinula edodes]